MASWNVSSSGKSVTVEAGNWLGALSAALPQLGLPQGSLGRLVCSILDGGGAEAEDPVTGTKVRIVPAGAASATPSSTDDVLGSDRAVSELVADAGDAPRPPPPPVREADIDRMVELFERCAEISAATDIRGACDQALKVLHELVPADAGAVLLQTRSGEHLRFASAVGPAASRVLDTTIPARDGIAGFSHDFIMGVVIEDARADERHYSQVDKQTKYQTKGILSVPVRTPDGASYGCMQLLNPPRRFGAEDLEVAETVSNALGAWLQTAML
ncbi:MAG: hypothetical protein RLZZ299_2008 [Pseudomonadota bacterium]|jgi:hypothetical protein